MNRRRVRKHNREAIEKFENPFIPFCRNCGRKLRSEQSVKRGYGPACAIYFAEKWIKGHPNTVGEGVKRLHSREEIKQALVEWLQNRREVK